MHVWIQSRLTSSHAEQPQLTCMSMAAKTTAATRMKTKKEIVLAHLGQTIIHVKFGTHPLTEAN